MTTQMTTLTVPNTKNATYLHKNICTRTDKYTVNQIILQNFVSHNILQNWCFLKIHTMQTWYPLLVQFVTFCIRIIWMNQNVFPLLISSRARMSSQIKLRTKLNETSDNIIGKWICRIGDCSVWWIFLACVVFF